MATEHPPHLYTLGQPSSSYIGYMDGINNRHRAQVNGVVSSSAPGHPECFHPLHAESDSEDPELPVGVAGGNWGKKALRGSRWVRRGKAVAWGPSKGEWEVEERARKRLKTMLAPPPRSPSPPTLSHLRESSPPLAAPYARPSSAHESFAAFVLDPAVAHSYRTHLLADLQQTTDSLIQGEATLTRALGRLWKVLSEEEHVLPEGEDGENGKSNDAAGMTNGVVEDGVDLEKHEEVDEVDDDMSERERRLARAPDLSQPMHKLFLTPFPDGGTNMMEPSHFGSPQMQLESMEKSLATLRELQDDSREYVERLSEIRESLGEVRKQRDVLWMKTREQALEELKEIDQSTVDGVGDGDGDAEV